MQLWKLAHSFLLQIPPQHFTESIQKYVYLILSENGVGRLDHKQGSRASRKHEQPHKILRGEIEELRALLAGQLTKLRSYTFVIVLKHHH